MCSHHKFLAINVFLIKALTLPLSSHRLANVSFTYITVPCLIFCSQILIISFFAYSFSWNFCFLLHKTNWINKNISPTFPPPDYLSLSSVYSYSFPLLFGINELPMLLSQSFPFCISFCSLLTTQNIASAIVHFDYQHFYLW